MKKNRKRRRERTHIKQTIKTTKAIKVSRYAHHHLVQCLLSLVLLVVTAPTSLLLVSSRWSPTWVSLSTTGVVLCGLGWLILAEVGGQVY